MKTRNITSVAAVLAALSLGTLAHAAGGDVGEAAKQSTNWTAIVMFGLFVAGTLWITKWAAAKTRSAADFYTGGGGITGFQNGLAIAGDYMSAASFLGISAAVMASGDHRYLLDDNGDRVVATRRGAGHLTGPAARRAVRSAPAGPYGPDPSGRFPPPAAADGHRARR